MFSWDFPEYQLFQTPMNYCFSKAIQQGFSKKRKTSDILKQFFAGFIKNRVKFFWSKKTRKLGKNPLTECFINTLVGLNKL